MWGDALGAWGSAGLFVMGPGADAAGAVGITLLIAVLTLSLYSLLARKASSGVERDNQNVTAETINAKM